LAGVLLSEQASLKPPLQECHVALTSEEVRRSAPT
jgi:hypothetical protein